MLGEALRRKESRGIVLPIDLYSTTAQLLRVEQIESDVEIPPRLAPDLEQRAFGLAVLLDMLDCQLVSGYLFEGSGRDDASVDVVFGFVHDEARSWRGRQELLLIALGRRNQSQIEASLLAVVPIGDGDSVWLVLACERQYTGLVRAEKGVGFLP